jgi:serine kinase of HPr protein (carbohydrate metabolism regulator)
MSAATADGGGAVRMHATCVAIGGKGALLRGPPGSGKSDLALRLIAGPPPEGQRAAYLVADDQVALSRENDRLIARAPQAIAGLLEIRGVGIRRVPSTEAAQVALIVDLVSRDTVLRLPPEPLPTEDLLGLPFPVAKLAPFEASAPLKLRALLGAWGGGVV